MMVPRKVRPAMFLTTPLFLAVLLFVPDSTCAQEVEAPSSESGDDGNVAGPCKSDVSFAAMCQQCAALPADWFFPTAEECCTDKAAGAVCQQCLSDPVSCLLQIVDVENALLSEQDSADDKDAQNDVIDGYDVSPGEVTSDVLFENDDAPAEPGFAKRYGTLYLGKRPRYLPLPKTLGSGVMKRGDEDDTADPTQNSDDVGDMKKRWGTLGLGSRTYGRYARRYRTPGNPHASQNGGNRKRWGTLAMGKRWGFLGLSRGKRGDFDKRWGTLSMGKRSDALDIAKLWESPSMSKKWGSLGIGKRWGSLGIGNWKRWGSLGLGSGRRLGSWRVGKRWGSLGIGKRSFPHVYSDADELQALEEEKRWGSLGLGGSKVHWDPRGKRWGTLGIGKRQEEVSALDNENQLLDALDNDEKRWGTLGIGKRWGTLNFGVDDEGDDSAAGSDEKRWGSLGIGKRWGSLGGFGGFQRWRSGRKRWPSDVEKRWGTLGIGRRSEDPQVSDDAVSEAKRWGTLNLSKKWGSLGLGAHPADDQHSQEKRWGTLFMGKRTTQQDESSNVEGPAEKKWGTLGIGKKWGSLGLGDKRSYKKRSVKNTSSVEKAEKHAN